LHRLDRDQRPARPFFPKSNCYDVSTTRAFDAPGTDASNASLPPYPSRAPVRESLTSNFRELGGSPGEGRSSYPFCI